MGGSGNPKDTPGEPTAATVSASDGDARPSRKAEVGIPAPGDEILGGKYRIVDILGSGGMGIVAIAEQKGLRRRVAFKFLRASLTANEALASRFLREGELLASLKSEHVARVLDVGVLESGAHYLIMEHLEGRDVAKIIERDVLPVETAVDWILQACEALAEAHAAGIVHRDIKPSNLFVTNRPDGSELIKVIDFGISKAPSLIEEPDPQLTYEGELLGSPSYMSPEQVRNASRVDARADVWALGITLLEMCTGLRPFRRTTFAATCAAIVSDDAPKAHEARRDVPEGLANVIARCLEKDPARRFADVGELAGALAPFAPFDSRSHARRAERLLRGRGPDVSLSSPNPETSRRSVVDVTTIASSSTSRDAVPSIAPPKKSRRRLAVVAAALVVGGVAIALSLRQPRAVETARPMISAPPPSAPAPPVVPTGEPTAAPSATVGDTAPIETSVVARPSAKPPVFAPSPRTNPKAATPVARPSANTAPSSSVSAPRVTDDDLLRQRR